MVATPHSSHAHEPEHGRAASGGESHPDHPEHGHDHEHEHEHAHDDGLLGRLGHLVAPHSHDAADSVDDALAGSAAGIRAVKISLIGLGLTAGLQLVVAVASGSVAVLADTIHNFADALTAVPLWLAFSVSTRPANRRYTYGYGRAEDLAGLAVVLMIAGSAVVAAYESLERLLHPDPVNYLGWVVAAGLIGFIGNEAVAQYRIGVGQRIGSAALVADGYHARTDGLTSLAVVIGAAGVWAGIPQADPLVGLGITLAILVVLKDAVVQMWHRLMDAVDPAILDEAQEAAAGVEGVQSVTEMRARWIGHTMHAEMHLTADCDISLTDAHAIGEQARHAMLHAVPKLASVTVHVDPCDHHGDDHHADLAHHDVRAVVGRRERRTD